MQLTKTRFRVNHHTGRKFCLRPGMSVKAMNNVNTNNVSEQALSLSERFSWSIVPVGVDKKPLDEWKKYQNQKAGREQLQEWFKKYPAANIGVVTGKISNLVVLDIDPRHGGNEDLFDEIITVKSKTGGGGWHYYFNYKEGIHNQAGIINGLDVRGEGGYVVVPPSLHKSGNRYKWINSPFDTPIIDVPSKVLAILQNGKTENNQFFKNWDETVLNGVNEGKRNESAASVVGKLLGKYSEGEWESEVWPLFEGWNLKNKPPLSEVELRAVYNSISDRELKKRGQNLSNTRLINDYEVNLGNSSYIEIKKDGFRFLIKPKRSKIEITLYKEDEIINTDSLNLISSKARTIFINNCIQLSEEEKYVLTGHLIALNQVLKEVNEEILNSMYEEKKAEITDEETEEARNLLFSPTLLNDILKTIKKTGVAGEEKTVLTYYLGLTSRITEDPLSIIVKGESSVGKSYGVSQVLRLFPPEAYIDISDATAQSFFYAPKGHFAHKIIVVFERHGQEKSEYSIRTLQSEKKLKIQVTVKNPETGQFETREHEVEGPSGFITTTTEAVIHAENETRNLSLYPDESIDQTRRTFEVTDSKYRGIPPISNELLNPWRNLQRVLKPYEVYIPYVEDIRKIFPEKPTRVRRDYGKLLALISVVTLLHQEQREKEIINGVEYLVSTLVDFYITKVLMEDTLKKTIFALPPKSEQLINSAKELLEENIAISTFTVRDLANRLDWDYDTAKKWFDPAFQKGYFALEEAHKGSKAAIYKLSDKEISSLSILPRVEKLYEINPDWLGNQKIYDPIEGNILNFEKEDDSVGKKISSDAPMVKESVQNSLIT